MAESRRALIEDAIEDITHWSGYAPDYFKEKWGLDDDLAKWRSRLEGVTPKDDYLPDPPADMSLNEKQAWKEGWMEGWIAQPRPKGEEDA